MVASVQGELNQANHRRSEVRSVTETIEAAVATRDSAETIIARLANLRPKMGEHGM